jgi:hypothetical protein
MGKTFKAIGFRKVRMEVEISNSGELVVNISKIGGSK